MVSQKLNPKQTRIHEFLIESSIHGLRLLLFYTPFKYARFLWKILIVAVIAWAHFIIINLIIQYIGQPTEVRMSTHRVHISNSPFPAFAVCNGNKFSRKKLQAFAEKVFEQQQLYRPNYLAATPQEMAQHMLFLDDFYITPHDSRQANETILTKLDQILMFMYNGSQYPTRDILRQLGPDCDSLIIRGNVYGVPVSVADYFSKRLTSSGPCCMFNYKRTSNAINAKTRDVDNNFIQGSAGIQFQANSILNSVQFVLQTDPDDFTIRDLDIDAFLVTVFPEQDYAHIQSSHIGEILVDYNTIVEIPVQPEFYESAYRIRQFAPKLRQCYFPDEGQKLLNNSFYSIDECLLQCRTESMLKHCGCVSPPMVATSNKITHCNFTDLPCLRQWNAVWYGWDYFDYVQEADPNVMGDLTARCLHCMPSCNGVKFRTFRNEMTLRKTYGGGTYSHGLLKGLDDKKPLAIIKLFFKQRFAQATQMDIVGDWVVLLNSFGGILGLMYGFSLISYIEISYFATGKFFVFFWNKWKVEKKVNSKEKLTRKSTAIRMKNNVEEQSLPAYSLYWNELKPKRRPYIWRFHDKFYS